MESRGLVWMGILVILTGAYVVGMRGVRSARAGHIQAHAHWMFTMCTVVGAWLVLYVCKQAVLGPERFAGSLTQYWTFYVPVLTVHTALAITTVGLAGYNLYVGMTRLRNGTGMGAMIASVSSHRRLGRFMVWSFSGTMGTAYVVYVLLYASQ
jgi:putative membrane protein